MKLRFSRVIALVTVLVLVLAACSPSDDEGTDDTEAPDATEAPTDTEASADTEAPDDGGDMGEGMYGLPVIDPLSVDTSVDVGIAGSSTVYPLSELVLDQWIDDGGPQYTLESIGSGGGLEKFCTTQASDIANASRPIKEGEIENCLGPEGSGEEPGPGVRTIIEVRIGTDALTNVISSDNDFASELTLEQLATAFSLPKGSSWSDVDPSFPDKTLQCFSPGEDSGTYDFFFETVFPDLYEQDPRPAAPMLDSCEIVGEDDNITVEGVSLDSCGTDGGTCGIGYFGFAYYQQNASVLQPVAVDAGDGPIVPGDDSVNEGTYPIARPLFMYTAEEVVSEKLPVAQFMAYYLNNVNDLIGEIGYFPAPEEALEEAAANILAAAPDLAG